MGAKLAERVPPQTVVGSMNRGTNTAALVGVARETLYATTDSAGLSWAAWAALNKYLFSIFFFNNFFSLDFDAPNFPRHHTFACTCGMCPTICSPMFAISTIYQNCMSSLLPPVCGKVQSKHKKQKQNENEKKNNYDIKNQSTK